jgi:hypothetical protein
MQSELNSSCDGRPYLESALKQRLHCPDLESAPSKSEGHLISTVGDPTVSSNGLHQGMVWLNPQELTKSQERCAHRGIVDAQARQQSN